MFFRDLSNNPMYGHAMTIASGGDAQGGLYVFCMSGYQFFADPVPFLQVQARLHGDLDWTDLETTPIDLTPHAGLWTRFDLNLIADPVTKRKRVQPLLRVKRA
jgi:hypothetical protein